VVPVLSLALLLPCPARAVPAQEPGVETVVVGGSARPAAAAARGTWEVGADGVRLTTRATGGTLDYWLSPATVGDGFVRARFALDGAPDCTLLLRASVGAEPEALEGLGVSLERNRVVVHRWREGNVVALGPAVEVEGLEDRKSVELAVWLVGPQLVAVVHDGTTLEALATITATDRSFARGRLGVRIHPDHAEDQSLTALSVLNTQLGAAPRPPAQDPFGERRLLTLPHGTLPEDRVVRRTLEGEWAVTTPEEVEAWRRRGVEPVAITGHVPRWADDGRYRSVMWRPYPRTADGFDLGAGWKDWLLVQDIVLGLAGRYPDLARAELLGRSAQGRPLWALHLGDEDVDDEPAVLFVAAHHGSELPSIDHALDVAQWLLVHRADPPVAAALRDLDLWVVPLVNPDGNWDHLQVDRDFGRRNATDTDGDGVYEPWEGVDLNRNYPFGWGVLGEKGSRSWRHDGFYRGPSPGSEPEVRAVMALADRRRFAAMVSFHTSATKLLSPYTIDGKDNPAPDVAWALAEDLADATLRQPNGRRYEVRRKLYSVDGTDQDWFFHTHGTLAFLLESSIDNGASPEAWRGAIDGTRPVATALLDDVLWGPWIGGTVRDAEGRPVEAEVTIDAITLREGEVWTSRRRDGRYDRRVPGPGRYVVTARAPGQRPVSRAVQVGDERVRLDLQLASSSVP
jgi:hypothetical protein